MYILLCSNESYYVGSTTDLPKRWNEHLSGIGADHTRKYPPIELVYCEAYQRIDLAFNREQQVKRWRRQKKEALISGEWDWLPILAKPYRDRDKLQELIGKE